MRGVGLTPVSSCGAGGIGSTTSGFQVLLEVASVRLEPVIFQLCRIICPVAPFGQDHEVVRLVSPDEGVNHLHRMRERHESVVGAVNEQELTFEISGQTEIRRIFILFFVLLRRAKPLGVSMGVKIRDRGDGDTHVIDVGCLEQGSNCEIATKRLSLNAHPAEIHIRACLRKIS